MKNKELIKFMFEKMYDLEKGRISIEKARTFSQMATQINNANRNILQKNK